MEEMRVGIIDVGSNTVRLLVGDVRSGSVESIREEREFLGLGAEILAHDRIRLHKLRRVAEVTEEYAAIARQDNVRRLETVVTAPGRQGSSADELVSTLARATDASVRVVSAEEEGRLAFLGAVSRSSISEGVVAVCDVGGGSTEIVLGTPHLDPGWIRSVNLGSLRLTAAKLPGDPPAAADIAAARSAVTRRARGIRYPEAGSRTGYRRERARDCEDHWWSIRAGRTRPAKRRTRGEALGGERSPTRSRTATSSIAARRRFDPA